MHAAPKAAGSRHAPAPPAGRRQVGWRCELLPSASLKSRCVRSQTMLQCQSSLSSSGSGGCLALHSLDASSLLAAISGWLLLLLLLVVLKHHHLLLCWLLRLLLPPAAPLAR